MTVYFSLQYSSSYIHSLSPTLVPPTAIPSTATPSTVTPSSSYPSMSPSTTFIISTVAGTGTGSYSGDNGAATSAGINYAPGIALDASGMKSSSK